MAATKKVELGDLDQQLTDLCQQAKRVARVCELLGFEFRGADRLVTHLTGAMTHTDVEPLQGQGDAVQILEDPDLRPYIWELTD